MTKKNILTILILSVFFGCKPRVSSLSDYSASHYSYLATIKGGTILLDARDLIDKYNDSGLPEPDYAPDGNYYPPEPGDLVNVGNTYINVSPTLPSGSPPPVNSPSTTNSSGGGFLDSLQNFFSRPSSENRSSPRSKGLKRTEYTVYADGEDPSRQEIAKDVQEAMSSINEPESSISYKVREAIQSQLQLGLRQFEHEGMVAAFNKLNVTNIKVNYHKFSPLIAGDSNKYYFELTYDATFPAQISRDKAKNSLDYYSAAPASESLFSAVYENYRACSIQSDTDIFDVSNFFYYFDPKKCDFAAINAQHKFFEIKTIHLQLTQKADYDGGKPEYNRMWEDGRFVATFVFGSHAGSADFKSADAGAKAFRSFLNKLAASKKLALQSEIPISSTNIRRVYKYTGPRLNNLVPEDGVVDIQAIFVSQLDQITPELANLIFGDRIGPSDFFTYNGHSGYGHNIEHLTAIIKPTDEQYVLFFLNGCWTYSYAQEENKNFDIIANVNQSLFEDMSRASILSLEGLLSGESNHNILSKLPKAQGPIIVGEETCSQ